MFKNRAIWMIALALYLIIVGVLGLIGAKLATPIETAQVIASVLAVIAGVCIILGK